MGKAGVGLGILRVIAGIIFITHGWPKLFAGGVNGLAGMLGGRGFPLPLAWAWSVTLLETVGGLLLVLGIFTVPIALLFAIEMVFAMALVHAANGWYVIGPGQGGVEFNVILIAALLALALAGPGAWALGNRWRRAGQ